MHAENVVYGQVLGAGLLADIAGPDEGNSFPVILSVHGGRWIRGDRQDSSAINVKQWAEAGFFAMSIDYRLVTCTPAPACYQDMLCAIRWIHAHASVYHLNTDQFYLIGMSAGGHMVSLAATLGKGNFGTTGGWEDQPHDFTAAISVSGAYDLQKLDWGSGWLPTGESWDDARKYASPLTHVTKESRPILMLHSDDDGSVPIHQAIAMKEKMVAVGAPHEFVHYSDRGHIPINEEVVTQSQAFIGKYRG